MNNAPSYLILLILFMQSCATSHQPAQETAERTYLSLDSIEFKIVISGNYRDCIQDIWETPWYPNRSRYPQDSILWYASRGLFDSVEVVVEHETIFKGMLKDFFKPECNNDYSLIYHGTYYNLSRKKLPILAIINYSRRSYQTVYLTKEIHGREKSIVFDYFALEGRLNILYDYRFDELLNKQPKGYVIRNAANQK